MADVIAERKVVYAGLWRQHSKSDYDTLLKQISSQLDQKGGLVSMFQLCRDGVSINVLNQDGSVKRKEKIPGQNIQDITVNRYNPICLLTVFVDVNRRLNYLVCRCDGTSDATYLVQTYRERKSVTSGEGYKIDLKEPHGLNWTLKRKNKNHPVLNGDAASSSTSSDKGDITDTNGNSALIMATSNGFATDDRDVFSNGNHHVEIVVSPEELVREPCVVDGNECFSVAVQTEFEYEDKQSLTSTTSFRSLKDELLNLSQEVKEIKLILQKTTGIGSTEYFHREKNMIDNHTGSRFMPASVDSNDGPHSPSSKSSSEGDRHVNFDQVTSVIFPDHNIRSLGVQTEKGKGQRYVKRQVQPTTSHPRNHAIRTRSRSSSAGSIPMSPTSVSPPASHELYVRQVVRQDDRSPGLNRSTIPMPMEHMYNAYTQEFKHPRRKIIVMPGSSKTLPPMRHSEKGHMRTIYFDKNGEKK
ncbi:uncharacterized protein LOC121390694 [Gigantopelta aegis]|uniref:uncharacterized protein LOC121390694 n=1 Tax=Gigantopelta aegis TaxID=1735272 RepID=UPI001B88CB95|nr:uncharacterized protein LOC121390694 [Gigantopelta aegis]